MKLAAVTIVALAMIYVDHVECFGYPAPPTPPKIYYGGFKPMVRSGRSYGSYVRRITNTFKPTKFFKPVNKKKFLTAAKYRQPQVQPVFQQRQQQHVNPQKQPLVNPQPQNQQVQKITQQTSPKQYPFGFKSLDAPALTSPGLSSNEIHLTYTKPYAIPKWNAGILPLQGEASNQVAVWSFPPYRR